MHVSTDHGRTASDGSRQPTPRADARGSVAKTSGASAFYARVVTQQISRERLADPVQLPPAPHPVGAVRRGLARLLRWLSEACARLSRRLAPPAEPAKPAKPAAPAAPAAPARLRHIHIYMCVYIYI